MKDRICVCLGENVRKYRKLRGMTQEKLAEELGLEIKSLSLIETGNCFVSSKTLAKLVNVFKVSPADLLNDCDPITIETLYSDTLNAIELLRNNPAKLRALNFVLNGLL